MALDQKKLATGHVAELMSEEENKKVQTKFESYGNVYRLQPGGWFFEEGTIDILDKLYNFPFRSTDVIVLTIPKSGTTWSQEITWSMLHNPNFDNPAAKMPIDLRSQQIEADLYFKLKIPAKLDKGEAVLKNAIKSVDSSRVDDEYPLLTYVELCLKQPRIIKTHLPISLFPPKVLGSTKIVYVARDPRDAIVSRYNYYKLFQGHKFVGTFDDFVDFFLKDEMFFSPYWLHLKEAWDLRHHPNVLFLRYEEMLSDPMKEYAKISEFLGAKLSEEQLTNIVEYTSFASMKKRHDGGSEAEPAADGTTLINQELQQRTGAFFRKGKSGDWKDKYTPEQVDRINDWIRKSTEDFPKEFPYLIKDI